MNGLSFYRKVLDARTVTRDKTGNHLLYVDRHYIDETCFTCFDALKAKNRKVRRPDLTFAFADHTVPTRVGPVAFANSEIAVAVDRLSADCAAHGIEAQAIDSEYRGIAHVAAPDLGLTLPGYIVVGSDSHMPTHGGLGAIGLGIGLSEQTHVLATQTLWHKPLRDMRLTLDGVLAPYVTAKDLVLSIIARIGAGGAIGYAVEIVGPCATRLSVEQRMTLCNMMVEGGARTAFVPPDETTIAYLAARPRIRTGRPDRELLEEICSLRSDDHAEYSRDEVFDVSGVAPMVTWGTSPQDAVTVDGIVPDPGECSDAGERARRAGALDYMGLRAGMRLTDIPINQVFIGSCTNGRIEDLRAAAEVLKGRRAIVPGIVAPGSQSVKRQAEAEGLADVFRDAGLEWRNSGCSMCAAMNGDTVASQQRCASTTNRNFRGRQGTGSRTHLMSPAMAAAAAITGHIADVRSL
jgi:3-isopropylmalate/(R)-2-methylmalate dehydratase large subunit